MLANVSVVIRFDNGFTAKLEIREFENGPFLLENSVNYQGILIEYQGNQGKIS